MTSDEFKAEVKRHRSLAQFFIDDIQLRSLRVAQKAEAFDSKKSAALDAWQAAKELAEQPVDENDQSATAARLAELGNKLAEAEAANAALKEAAATLAASPLYGEPKAEWEECRKSIDRFDKILVDLRKSAFGVITTIFSAAAFLFTFSATATAVPPRIKVAVFVVICLLIVSTYFVDRIHQIWLEAAVIRARELEDKLGFALTGRISDRFRSTAAGMIWIGLYAMLLIMGGIVFNRSIDREITEGHQITILIVLTGSIAIVGISGFYPKILEIKARFAALPSPAQRFLKAAGVLIHLSLLICGPVMVILKLTGNI